MPANRVGSTRLMLFAAGATILADQQQERLPAHFCLVNVLLAAGAQQFRIPRNKYLRVPAFFRFTFAISKVMYLETLRGCVGVRVIVLRELLLRYWHGIPVQPPRHIGERRSFIIVSRIALRLILGRCLAGGPSGLARFC